MVTQKKIRGDYGEEIAVSYLEDEGYQVLTRNYKTRYGEIDIIAMDGKELTFVEVRTFSKGSYVEPEESVFKRKRRKIINTARMYITENKTDCGCRFDVIGISLRKGGQMEIRLIKDAFRISDRF